MNIAFRYKRTSTGRQDYSLKVQDQQCDEYCSRLGFEKVYTFEDPDTSTRTPMNRRDGGARMLMAIKQATLDHPDASIHLVALKQDRLGRDTIDQISTIRLMWQWGVMPHLVLETGPLPKTSSNELLMEIKASVNQHERNTIRERIKTTLDNRKSQGFLTGTLPYGKDKVDTGTINPATGKPVFKVVDNDYEKQWIAQIKAWHAEGLSHWAIAKMLNERGVPRKVKAGTLITVKRDKETGRKIQAEVAGLWKPITVWKIINPDWKKRDRRDRKAA